MSAFFLNSIFPPQLPKGPVRFVLWTNNQTCSSRKNNSNPRHTICRPGHKYFKQISLFFFNLPRLLLHHLLNSLFYTYQHDFPLSKISTFACVWVSVIWKTNLQAGHLEFVHLLFWVVCKLKMVSSEDNLCYSLWSHCLEVGMYACC